MDLLAKKRDPKMVNRFNSSVTLDFLKVFRIKQCPTEAQPLLAHSPRAHSRGQHAPRTAALTTDNAAWVPHQPQPQETLVK